MCAKFNKSIDEFPRSAPATKCGVTDRRRAGLPDIRCYDNTPAPTSSGGGGIVVVSDLRQSYPAPVCLGGGVGGGGGGVEGEKTC